MYLIELLCPVCVIIPVGFLEQSLAVSVCHDKEQGEEEGQVSKPMTQPSCPLGRRAFLGILSSFEQAGYWRGCPDLMLCSCASGHSCQLTLVLVLTSSAVWVLGSTGFGPLNPKSRSSGFQVLPGHCGGLFVPGQLGHTSKQNLRTVL